MKRTLIQLFVVLILGIAAVGFLRQWFVVSSSRETEGNKVHVDLTVDTDKVKDDAAKVTEKTEELTDRVKDEAPKLIDRD
jgi:hypothetical protein